MQVSVRGYPGRLEQLGDGGWIFSDAATVPNNLS